MSIKALLAGAASAMALDLVFSIVLASDLGVFHDPRAARSIMSDLPALIGALFYGTVVTAVGGYVAGCVAKRAFYLHAAVVGIAGIVIGACAAGHYPMWFNLISIIGSLPAALLGGAIARQGYETSS